MATVAKTRIAVKPMREKRPFLSKAADVFCVAVGFSTVFAIHFIGDLYVAEILLLLAFPWLMILRGKRALRRELKMVYILLGLWLLGLVISDAYHEIAIVDRMRGVALIVFFAIDILGMSVLIGHNEKRKILFLVGLMVGTLASVKLQPSPSYDDYPWKFGWAWGTMQLVMLIASYLYSRRGYIVSGLLVLGLCAINLVMNYRSPVLGLLITLALVYPIIPERFGGIQVLPHSNVARLLVLGVLAVCAAEAAGALVSFVTQAGYVSEDAKAKNEAQAKAGNILLGGRPEFAIGLRAALDSPIVGHGSWAKDMKYDEMLFDAMIEEGVQEDTGDFEREADGLIPGHSHIVTAWVWAGIVGPIFWAYVVFYVFRGMAQIAVVRPPLAPLYMWFLISMCWDIFFSPFAAFRRMIEAVMIVILADLLEKKVVILQPQWRRMGAARPRRSSPAFGSPVTPGGIS